MSDFCKFCVDTLGVPAQVPLTVLELLETSNDTVKVPKLVAMLKVMSSSLNAIDENALTSVLAEADGTDKSCLGSTGSAERVMMEDLAYIVNMDPKDLQQALEGISEENMIQEMQSVLSEILASEAKYVKLPQGLAAPFVAARHREQAGSYRVPVWSLRAQAQFHQPKRASGLTATALSAHHLHLPFLAGVSESPLVVTQVHLQSNSKPRESKGWRIRSSSLQRQWSRTIWKRRWPAGMQADAVLRKHGHTLP